MFVYLAVCMTIAAFGLALMVAGAIAEYRNQPVNVYARRRAARAKRAAVRAKHARKGF